MMADQKCAPGVQRQKTPVGIAIMGRIESLVPNLLRQWYSGIGLDGSVLVVFPDRRRWDAGSELCTLLGQDR